jgi:diguanylate cyclase (GGDEF)-like protein
MRELVHSVAQYGLEPVLEHIHAMVVLVEPDGSMTSWNRAFHRVKNVMPAATSLEEFVPAEERADFRHRLISTQETNVSSHWTADLIVDTEGQRLGCDCLLVPLSNGRVLFVAERVEFEPVVSEMIERLHRQVELFRIESDLAKKIAVNKQKEVEAVVAQAHEVSHIDQLTLLPNRRQIIKELQNEVLRAERYKMVFSISMVDIDHFKKINDTFGHTIGDDALRQIAFALREHIRQPDTVGRYGGEEFLILLPNTALEAASEQAARLCRNVRASPILIDDRKIHLTISIGVAQYQNAKETWQSLLNRADNALYEAKRGGRDGWALSS